MSHSYASRTRPPTSADAHLAQCLPRLRSAPSLALLAGRPLIPDLADRLLTGCLYDTPPPVTYPILVTRSRPKRCAVRFRAWWRELAPSVALLHTAAPEDSTREGFVRAYRAELNALPLHVWYRALLHLAEWLQVFPTATLLSFERAPSGFERQILTQQSVLRAWLLMPSHPSACADCADKEVVR